MTSPEPRRVLPYETGRPVSHWRRFGWLWAAVGGVLLLGGGWGVVVSLAQARVNAERVRMAAPPNLPVQRVAAPTTPTTQPR